MNKFTEANINSLLSLVKGSIVFLDDSSAECLHWCNGLSKLLNAGALDVRDIKHTKVTLYVKRFLNVLFVKGFFNNLTNLFCL